jgi:hypothetical protein
MTEIKSPEEIAQAVHDELYQMTIRWLESESFPDDDQVKLIADAIRAGGELAFYQNVSLRLENEVLEGRLAALVRAARVMVRELSSVGADAVCTCGMCDGTRDSLDDGPLDGLCEMHRAAVDLGEALASEPEETGGGA